ncbi:hypothetical protein CGRA01v4_12974 [Colletotrichum graminicola]|nr:hypothetical protein CGRA01v4_12974 [Colletotrichum graminicola]
MTRTHDLIHNAAYKFATKAWLRFQRDEEESIPTSIALLSTVCVLFFFAFYRVELFYNLFSDSMHIIDNVIQSTFLSEGMNPWSFEEHTS